MPLVRRMRRRGVTITVEAHGEVLFAGTGDVGRWTNRFSQRVRSFTAQAAPSNKRPRWAHYGKPLKQTFRASTTYQPGRMKVYAAVGSTAPYAAYPDQGTGIYGGSGPYQGKILPPWHVGSPSLYESTWRPGPGQPPVGTITIKGQKGQFFFDKGLQRAFASMRMRSFQVPGDAQISAATGSFPAALERVVTSGGSSAAFRASLTEWRSWRDDHFHSGRLLGKNGGRSSAEAGRRQERAATAAARRRAISTSRAAVRAQRSAERSRKWREQQKAKSTAKPPRTGQTFSQRKSAERARFVTAAQKKYGRSHVDLQSLTFEDGYWYVTISEQAPNSAGVQHIQYRDIRGRRVE